MLRRIAVLFLVTAVFFAILVFTFHNKGPVNVHLVFAEIDTTVSLALAVTFALGWLFGIACTGFFALRLVHEKRSLKRSLRISETEVSSLRKLPLADAD